MRKIFKNCNIYSMNIVDIINNATNFGTFEHRQSFFSFVTKMLFYLIPAIIFGHYTDASILKLKTRKLLGNNIINYILLQILSITITLFILIKYLEKFVSEFQMTITGSFFIVLYFGLQTNFLYMIQKYMKCGKFKCEMV